MKKCSPTYKSRKQIAKKMQALTKEEKQEIPCPAEENFFKWVTLLRNVGAIENRAGVELL